MSELINTSLEVCAERAGDISSIVYQNFFASNAQANKLMAHADEYMQGRMIAETVGLLLTDEHFGASGYLNWEVKNHLLAYGVSLDMYGDYLLAIKKTVQTTLGDDWSKHLEDAWSERIGRILNEIQTEAKALA